VLVDDLLTQMQELTNLVGDLSELARGEQRLAPPAPIRLDQLVEDAVTVATTHGRPRNVHFELRGEPMWVCGQRERITRAVGNLLDNALKWSPDGGTVEVWCGGGVVAVRDHGPGIAPEDLPHVFDRFYRAPSARALPGSGLGLAIVAQVAEAEGGSVTAANAEGGGAAFRLQLPEVDAPPPHAGLDDD
jgi:signal transduction histidine kinase